MGGGKRTQWTGSPRKKRPHGVRLRIEGDHYKNSKIEVGKAARVVDYSSVVGGGKFSDNDAKSAKVLRGGEKQERLDQSVIGKNGLETTNIAK